MDKLVSRRNPDVVTNTVLRDMSDLDPISAKNERFQFGFVWTSMLDWKFYEHDPRIAIANTRQTNMQLTPFIEFTNKQLKLENCKQEQFDHLSDPSKYT